MRTTLSTIQQTLTAEAAGMLRHAVQEAARRQHAQTTPLHVAAALLASPSGLLCQACIRSHPNSAQPLQCRALELCFSVALDRLPISSSPIKGKLCVSEPSVSNALKAALKRAQASQRRRWSKHQQQPLVAVKVELDLLVISILDDPSVGRVMREASFSSAAVRATIEQYLTTSATSSSSITSASQIAIRSASSFPSTAFGSINALQCPELHSRLDDVMCVLDILAHGRKRNTILVGDSNPKPILQEVIRRIKSGADHSTPPQLRVAEVISFEKELAIEWFQIQDRIREMRALIESRIGEVCFVIDLGDIKWLVEGSADAKQDQEADVVSQTSRAAVVEMTRLLRRFREGDVRHMWLVGTANSATYLRCQVYHPSMENDWDLQAVLIAQNSPLPHFYLRPGVNGFHGCSIYSQTPMTTLLSSNTVAIVPSRRFQFPLECRESTQKSLPCSLYAEDNEREQVGVVAHVLDASASMTKPDSQPPVPPWLQKVQDQEHFQCNHQESKWKQSNEEQQERWPEKCSRIYPLCADPICQRNAVLPQSLDSTVETDLILGLSNASCATIEKVHKGSDADSEIESEDDLKRLLSGLTERVAWQAEAATAVIMAVVRCKFGIGKQIANSKKCGAWLLFVGPDKVGKLKMAAVLSELMSGASPIIVCPHYWHSNGVHHGRTSLDKVVEALRQNPFSVILVEDWDHVDSFVKSTLKCAKKRGRLADSHGREVSLGNAIFVLTTALLHENLHASIDSSLVKLEEKILRSASSEWLLEFSMLMRSGKHRSDWFCANDEQRLKLRRKLQPDLSLNLNLSIGSEDDTCDSRNSSDVTMEHEPEQGQCRLAIMSHEPDQTVAELCTMVDETVVFRHVDFVSLKRKVLQSMRAKFDAFMNHEHSIIVEDDVLDRIIGGMWVSGRGIGDDTLENWTEKVLLPAFYELKSCLKASANAVTVRLGAKRGDGKEYLSKMVSLGAGVMPNNM
ncbi:hypothetical protein HPP92_013002 [Vanilla planifolia]|uniref:Clp R domain-containing protein n=1 Tax=Vanilla planifolia TaxID=51239 RepID=A0A835UYD8_VANPL|nr:hypothetical protein HPP92_013002 [Vanilla planifolia]